MFLKSLALLTAFAAVITGATTISVKDDDGDDDKQGDKDDDDDNQPVVRTPNMNIAI